MKPTPEKLLRKETLTLADDLNGLTLDDPIYNDVLSTIERIEKVRAPLVRRPLDYNVVFSGVVSIGTVWVIQNRERVGEFLTTKALPFVQRTRT